jgi:MFS family permease
MLKTNIHDPGVVRFSRMVNGSPIFYGWIIMLAGTLGMIMTSPGQTYVISVFLEHIIADLGISRSLVSTLYTVGTLVGSFALPVVGRQIDRRGARLMVGVITALFGLACLYMGFVQNALMLGLGFIAIRMLGQGSLGLVSQNVINQWWVRRRGTMMGISGVLVGLLGLGGFPIIINWLIPIYGWRWTYILLGMALLALMVPVGLIFFRDRPEEFGLQPDSAQDLTDPTAALTEIEEVWTLTEARRTPTFWVASIGLALIAMLSTGLFFHMVSIFEDNGLSATIAASVFFPIALTTALVNLGGGVLIDRIPTRFLLVASLFGLALSLMMAQYLNNVAAAIVYGIMLGVTTSLMGLVNHVIWAIYFGRQHLGSITGLTTTILIAGAALGPMPLGVAHDLLGSYNQALTLFALLPLGLGVANLFFGKPEKSDG